MRFLGWRAVIGVQSVSVQRSGEWQTRLIQRPSGVTRCRRNHLSDEPDDLEKPGGCAQQGGGTMLECASAVMSPSSLLTVLKLPSKSASYDRSLVGDA